jgi:hypothetical protein
VAERVIIVNAPEQGYDHFSRGDCRSMVGRSFPMEDASGRKTGEGIIRRAVRLDPYGQRVSLTVEIPDHLAKGLETDAGRVFNPIER